ncbi:hypothetical protein Mapa_011275 [Marchantia paleacea]|nr:hypothetical protein Mapa_011275 [Marchantia paleacea]
MTVVAVTVVEPNPLELMDTDSVIVIPGASCAVEPEDPLGRSPPRPLSGGVLRAEEIPEITLSAPEMLTAGNGDLRAEDIPETISSAPGILTAGIGALRAAEIPEAISSAPGILTAGMGALSAAEIPEVISSAPGMFKAGTGAFKVGIPNGGVGGPLRALAIPETMPGGPGGAGVPEVGGFRGFVNPEVRALLGGESNRFRAETPGTS